MAILLRCGATGDGKSSTSIGEALEHLRSGGVVATNFGLSKGWAVAAAGRQLLDRFIPGRAARRARSMWSRWFRIGTVKTINELSEQLPVLVEGKQARRLARWNRAGKPEGLGLLILDEGHIFFNSRDWKKNMDMIHFCSQSRKKGWNVVIIAHDAGMIDSQIRTGLINEEETMRNLAKVRLLPLVPVTFGMLTFGKPVFCGVRRLAGKGAAAGSMVGWSLRLLDPQVAKVYETMEEFNFLDVPDTFSRIGPPPALPEGGPNVQDVPQLRPFLQDIQTLVNPISEV